MTTSTALFTARAILDEFVRAGLRRVCVAPGSRSTALALAVAERNDLTSHVLTDERSMGFFALGLARAGKEPVAVVCTSGTAAANLLPAAAEAHLGGGALLLLTADRPPELRDCAAPQTIDQTMLFASHARWSVDVPLLNASEASARVLRSLASRAITTATRDNGGPVHLNIPLREPFVDHSFPASEPFAVGGRDDGQAFSQTTASFSLHHDEVRALAAQCAQAKRGVIVCAGREQPAGAIAALAKALGWPILADPLSGLRFGAHDRSAVADAIEPLFRSESIREELRPDFILRFGLTPPPRSVQRWLEESWPAEHVVVTQDPWPDPARSASRFVRADSSGFCQELASACSTPNDEVVAWQQRWLEMSATARSVLGRASDALFDGVVLRSVVEQLADGATLVVGNSMPVRDAEAFLPCRRKSLRVLANRGASGIDGVLSTALGVAVASGGPTALVLGDLSFLHDCSALVFAARERIPLLIVVVNNDGGGIFSFLPLRETLGTGGNEVFERFFGTPHGADLAKVASITGGFFQRVEDAADLDGAVAAALTASASGPAVLEVRTSREAGRLAQQSLVLAAQTAATQIAPKPRRSA